MEKQRWREKDGQTEKGREEVGRERCSACVSVCGGRGVGGDEEGGCGY